MSLDSLHQATCNWNLYAEQRPDPDLCNLECLRRPKEVAASWAYLAWQEAQAAATAALTAYNEALVEAINEKEAAGYTDGQRVPEEGESGQSR